MYLDSVLCKLFTFAHAQDVFPKMRQAVLDIISFQSNFIRLINFHFQSNKLLNLNGLVYLVLFGSCSPGSCLVTTLSLSPEEQTIDSYKGLNRNY